MTALRCGKFLLSLERPLIMGIVNLTPDSFSGDGLASQRDAALDQAWRMLEAGADLLDLGAESSRPGALPTRRRTSSSACCPCSMLCAIVANRSRSIPTNLR